jgi:hypothetical protein
VDVSKPEELWRESVRRFNARRHQDLCWQWIRYHEGMPRSHQTTSAILTAHHRQEIEKYEAMLGISHKGGDAA